jgi:hypothetical protein
MRKKRAITKTKLMSSLKAICIIYRGFWSLYVGKSSDTSINPFSLLPADLQADLFPDAYIYIARSLGNSKQSRYAECPQ